MFKFLDLDQASPKPDVKQDEIILSYNDKKLMEIEKGLEDGLDVIKLSEDLDNITYGLEEQMKKLPKYVRAYEILNRDLEEIVDYQAGLEDNLDMASKVKNISLVSKYLNIKVEELDHGLLDNDPDDEKNTNIVIRIIKKIFSAIIGIFKAIIGLVIKIIKTFFRFIRKILGLGDPATEVKKELEKTTTTSMGGGFAFYPSISGNNVKKANKKIKKADKTKTDNNGNNKASTAPVVKEEIENNEDIKEAIEIVEKLEANEAANLGVKDFNLTEEQKEKLENIAKKVENEYPLALIIANKIFEHDKGKIDLFDLLTVLYALSSSVAKANINCNGNKDGFTIERHIESFLEGIDGITSIMDEFNKRRETEFKDLTIRSTVSPYKKSYFASAIWFKLADMVDKVAPIYKNGSNLAVYNIQDSNDSILGTVLRFMNSMSTNLRTADDNFSFNINLIKKFRKKEFKEEEIEFNNIITPIVKNKLGDIFFESMKEYISVDGASSKADDNYKHMVEDMIDKSGYKYFRTAVLTFDRKNIKILVHLSNVSDLNKLREIYGLPEPGHNMHGTDTGNEIAEKYSKFFKEDLPKLSNEIKGKFIIIEMKVTSKDLMEQTDLDKIKEINFNPMEVTRDKLSLIKLMEELTNILTGSIDDLESCLSKTEKLLNKAKKDLDKLEKDFMSFTKWLGKNMSTINRGENKVWYKQQLSTSEGNNLGEKSGLSSKITTASSIKKGLLTIGEMLHSTSEDIIQIYKNVVIEDLKVVKSISSDKVISTYIGELLDYYEIKDGIGG